MREKSVNIGKRPFGHTDPEIYLCGHCRNAQISADAGICEPCHRLFENRQEKRANNIQVLLTAILIIAVLILILGFIASLSASPNDTGLPKKEGGRVVRQTK